MIYSWTRFVALTAAWLDGAAIVYAGTRRRTEELAQGLRNRGWTAQHFPRRHGPAREEDCSGSVPEGGTYPSSWPRTHSAWV